MATTTNPDSPHGYRPRTLTRTNVPVNEPAGWMAGAERNAENRPCNVCGGSRFGLAVHNLPYRRPSLARALAAIESVAA